MTKILYSISSRYCNLNLEKIVHESKGNVRLIEYEPKCVIYWEEYSPEFKS